jgi:starch synthase (maltosyl-transferring)
MTRLRVMIEHLSPQVDGGRFAAKRIIGEPVTVEADVFTDGHDKVAAALRYRQAADTEWRYRFMRPLTNDRWQGEFTPESLGRHEFSVVAWIDHIGTWQRDLTRKREAGQDVGVDLLRGAALAEDLAARVPEAERASVIGLARTLADTTRSPLLRAELAGGELLLAMSRRYPQLELVSQHEPALPVGLP